MTGNVQHWKLFRSKPLIKLNKNEDQILHYCDVTQQIFVIQNSWRGLKNLV